MKYGRKKKKMKRFLHEFERRRRQTKRGNKKREEEKSNFQYAQETKMTQLKVDGIYGAMCEVLEPKYSGGSGKKKMM